MTNVFNEPSKPKTKAGNCNQRNMETVMELNYPDRDSEVGRGSRVNGCT
jgi:hypothetical protein